MDGRPIFDIGGAVRKVIEHEIEEFLKTLETPQIVLDAEGIKFTGVPWYPIEMLEYRIAYEHRRVMRRAWISKTRSRRR